MWNAVRADGIPADGVANAKVSYRKLQPVTKMFSGLMSKCTIPFERTWANPLATWMRHARSAHRSGCSTTVDDNFAG